MLEHEIQYEKALPNYFTLGNKDVHITQSSGNDGLV
jgi:hypothetical protein